MIGIASYDSDEEQVPPTPAPTPAPAKAPAPAAAPKATATTTTGGKGAKVCDRKVKELRKEISDANSATAVVKVVRRSLAMLDMRWTAEALHRVAQKSTARTRKEWAKDPSILKLAETVRNEAASKKPLAGQADAFSLLLLALEALRRLDLQKAKDQVPALERLVVGIKADRWQHPVKSLSRLMWLSTGVTLDGLEPLPQELRARAEALDGPDVALLLQAMTFAKGARDAALLAKVVGRIKMPDAFTGLCATDLVEMAESLLKLSAHDEEALRPLGQELLRRRGELTPDESHRAHAAYSSMKLPLPQVWKQAGAEKKRDGSQIVTTTTFVPQEGHEKRRRGNHDLERVSPPRVVRDMKMMSY